MWHLLCYDCGGQPIKKQCVFVGLLNSNDYPEPDNIKNHINDPKCYCICSYSVPSEYVVRLMNRLTVHSHGTQLCTVTLDISKV